MLELAARQAAWRSASDSASATRSARRRPCGPARPARLAQLWWEMCPHDLWRLRRSVQSGCLSVLVASVQTGEFQCVVYKLSLCWISQRFVLGIKWRLGWTCATTGSQASKDQPANPNLLKSSRITKSQHSLLRPSSGSDVLRSSSRSSALNSKSSPRQGSRRAGSPRLLA